MPSTRQQLATSVLRDSNTIAATETPSAEDMQYVIGMYDLRYAELASHGNEYVYWALNEIPDAVFLPMRDLVWNEVRSAYGQPIDADKKAALDTVIMRRIRRHVSTQSSGLPARACYF